MRANTNRLIIAGFNTLRHEDIPTVPVMIKDAELASEFADEILRYGIYVIGFSFLVVPQIMARIRVLLSSAHDFDRIDRTIIGFTEAGRAKGVIPNAN